MPMVRMHRMMCCVDERVVFLPEETADARPAGQHLGGDDHQPGDAEAEPEAGEHVRQRGGIEHLEERLASAKVSRPCATLR